MILSVSRRTDIPAFYTEWFFNRLQAGYVLVRNPMNYQQVSYVPLTPEVVDCIVFWTKDPANISGKLTLLKEYAYYFQVTITPYAKAIEPGVPAKTLVTKAFRELAGIIGPERMVWRYDPIILTDKMDIEYHCREFGLLAKELCGYTNSCIISFMDIYKKTERNMRHIPLQTISQEELLEFCQRLSAAAQKYKLKLMACSEGEALKAAGIEKASCIDEKLIGSILGQDIRIGKDPNQRANCVCAASIDIGAYNTCRHGCLYCYANFSQTAAQNNFLSHDPASPLLVGNIHPEDKITKRKLDIYRKSQLALF